MPDVREAAYIASLSGKPYLRAVPARLSAHREGMVGGIRAGLDGVGVQILRCGASEELDCIPANGGGAWLSRALIESRMSADTPVLRLTCKEGYELLSDEVRFRETQDWLDEHLKPLLEAPPH